MLIIEEKPGLHKIRDSIVNTQRLPDCEWRNNCFQGTDEATMTLVFASAKQMSSFFREVSENGRLQIQSYQNCAQNSVDPFL